MLDYSPMVLIALLLLIRSSAQGATPASDPAQRSSVLNPLTVYAGNWVLTPAAKPGTSIKSDHLTNHRHMVEAFYTCEQVVNGKAEAMLVFVAGEAAGSYFSQVVLPDGHAGGRSDLTIDGDHWTFVSKGEAGKPKFRVENFFKGRNHIHFEQYKADDAGAWTKTGEGDEVRVP